MNTRTITLTGRPPVKIQEELWPGIAARNIRPVITEADLETWRAENGFRNDSTQTKMVTLLVRRHADAGALVYGVWRHQRRWQFEHRQDDALQHEHRIARAGELVGRGGDVIAALKRVAQSLTEQSADGQTVDRAVRECIADLSAGEVSS